MKGMQNAVKDESAVNDRNSGCIEVVIAVSDGEAL
jgi:hypothetical protein